MQNRNNRLSSNSDYTKKEIESLEKTFTTMKESNSHLLVTSLRDSASQVLANVQVADEALPMQVNI